MIKIFNFLFLLISLSGFSQLKDSITENKLELGISLKKDFYSGANFINKSLQPQLNYEIDMLYNLNKGYWVGFSYFRNWNSIKSTEYIGDINNATLTGLGIKGKKIVPIDQKWSFIPQLNIGSAIFKYSLRNTEGNQKNFTTDGVAIGIESAIRYNAQKDFYIELVGAYRHIFFQNMKAPSHASVNYYATELMSIGTRFSVDF